MPQVHNYGLDQGDILGRGVELKRTLHFPTMSMERYAVCMVLRASGQGLDADTE